MNFSPQTTNGKAFEFALLIECGYKLRHFTQVTILKNTPYEVARKHFESLEEHIQNQYKLYASFAINFLLDVEPRLSHGRGDIDILELEIVTDKAGEGGDVRDILAIRSLQKWEIGISAKNNHFAIKHSRLSNSIDFGKKWFGIPCSQQYFLQIQPIFDRLSDIRTSSKSTQKWSILGNYHETIYVPILQAFQKELLSLNN